MPSCIDSFEEVQAREDFKNAQFARCRTLGACSMDCAVVVYGPEANVGFFKRGERDLVKCTLTDDEGKLKEIFSHETGLRGCSAGASTACSTNKVAVVDLLDAQI